MFLIRLNFCIFLLPHNFLLVVPILMKLTKLQDAYVAVNLQKVDLIRYPIDQCYIPLSKGTLLDKDLFKKITICATREGHRPSICAVSLF